MIYEHEMEGLYLDTESQIREKVCAHTAQAQDEVVSRALKRHLGVDDLDMTGLSGRCERIVRFGVPGWTFCVDGVPVVWVGDARVYNAGNAISVRFEHRYLGLPNN